MSLRGRGGRRDDDFATPSQIQVWPYMVGLRTHFRFLLWGSLFIFCVYNPDIAFSGEDPTFLLGFVDVSLEVSLRGRGGKRDDGFATPSQIQVLLWLEFCRVRALSALSSRARTHANTHARTRTRTRTPASHAHTRTHSLALMYIAHTHTHTHTYIIYIYIYIYTE